MGTRCKALVQVVFLACLLCGPATAQLGVEWAEVVENPTRLAVNPADLSDPDTEVDFAWGDLDKDGWTDVVCVRGPSASSLGERANVLLMNRDGVLRDETVLHASASDVAGDQGFLTPTNDRDVFVTDVDGDGWLDVVTATTLSDGKPKHLSHPRVYVNLREDGAGSWLGLMHEDARIPQLLTTGGLPVAPRFCDVTAGDVTGDGFPDLHFVDYDGTQTGIAEAAGADLNDRLLINDGTGFFVDESALRLTDAQLLSEFGLANVIADANGDGALDIVKTTSNGVPYDVFVFYNDPLNEGFFQLLGLQGIGSSSPYGMDFGDLNADGRLDVAIQDDAPDRFRLNQGNDVLGRVIWGPLKTFAHAGGSDPGFGHKVRIADLDGDSFNDVFINDFDIEFKGCFRRLHVYHNLGTAPGEDVTLREEAELASGDLGAGWKGVKGLLVDDMKGTMDVAVFDFDEDGDADILMGGCGGTRFWENVAITTPVVCQKSLGYSGPGDVVLSLCGEDLTLAGSSATLELVGAPPATTVTVAVGPTFHPTLLGPGTLVPFPPQFLFAFVTDAEGELHAPVPGGGAVLTTLYAQAAVLTAAPEVSNALEVQIGL